RLAQETVAVFPVEPELRFQQLDRERAVDFRVVRLVHARHRTFADDLADLIATQSFHYGVVHGKPPVPGQRAAQYDEYARSITGLRGSYAGGAGGRSRPCGSRNASAILGRCPASNAPAYATAPSAARPASRSAAGTALRRLSARAAAASAAP